MLWWMQSAVFLKNAKLSLKKRHCLGGSIVTISQMCKVQNRTMRDEGL